MTWYSSCYNGLAYKHFIGYRKGRVAEHDVIEYCEAHLDEESSMRLVMFSRTFAPRSAWGIGSVLVA